jgi:ADP-ribose pyrophosphatase
VNRHTSIGRRPVYAGRVVDLGIETARLPDGREIELEIVRHPGGAVAVAVDERQQVCLLRQYRHAAGGWIDELPAGLLEPDESPLAAAARELAEEAGIAAADWHSLGTMLSSPGFCTERLYLYLARDLTVDTAAPEADELIHPAWIPFDEALDRAMSGDIADAKTVVGLARAAALLDRG